MANYLSNKEIIIRTSDTGNIIFDASSLSNTLSLVCKYLRSEPNKLIDSTILRDVSFITLENDNTNIDDIFDFKSKNSFGVIYNIFDSLDTIHALAFNNCFTLQSCIIPENIIKLEEGIFSGCSSLRYISLPTTIEEICENVFNGCENLKQINNTDQIKILHQYSFAGCGIKDIRLNSIIAELPPYLFKNCLKLEKFESNIVQKLGEGTFSGCISLNVVNINYNGITEIKETEYKEPLTDVVEPSEEPTEPGEEPVQLTRYILLSPERYTIKQYDLTATDDFNEANRIIKSRAVTIQDGDEDSFKYLLLRENWITYHVYNETKTTELYTTNEYEDLVSLGDGKISSDNIFFKDGNGVIIRFIQSPDGNYDFHHAEAYKVKYDVYDESNKLVYYIAPKYARERLEATENGNDKLYHKTFNGDNVIGEYIDKNLKIELIDKFRLSGTGQIEYEYFNRLTGETEYYLSGETIPEGYEPVKTNGYPVYNDYFSTFGHSFASGGNEYSFTRLSTEIGVDLLRQYTLEEDIYLYPVNISTEEDFGISLTSNDMLDDYVYYTALDGEEDSGDDGGDSGDDGGSGDEGGSDDTGGNIELQDRNILPDMVFANCRKLTHDKISFIDQIQGIGYGAFMGCSSLDHIDSLINNVAEYGFKDCINLESINLSKCTTIKKYGFKNCIKLQEVNLSKLDPELNEGVFEDCESLHTIGTNYIDIIGIKGFKNCINLENYPTLNKIIRVEKEGFYNCKKLTVSQLNNLNNINYIGEYGFCKCAALNNINLNSGVILGNGAFKDCISLESITLPPSIKKLGNQTFNNCISLRKVEFQSNALDADFNMNAFDGCNNIKEVIIPFSNTSNIISINNNGVYNRQTNTLIYVAKNISKFEFTQELEGCIIDENAFTNCHITLIDMSSINAPDIEKNIFSSISNNQWFIFIRESDPNYKKYVRIIGYTHIKVCR